jgi:D-beta-D-heptose 7-phosphate kinase/D-beta-D-heptose 1-phosphate adenosyltransferase
MDIPKLLDKKALSKYITRVRREGKKIVLTSGSWDMLHVGHMRYLKSAKEQGDILIVGVDSDKKIQKRKGPDRPIVPEDERVEMLSYLGYIDVIFLKKHSEQANNLIRLVLPDILVISESTKHDPKKYKEVKNFCDKLLILKPQAETSTTARIRKLHVSGKKDLVESLLKEIPNFVQKFLEQK